MKAFRKKIRSIGALVAAAFVAVGIWFADTVYTQSAVWTAGTSGTRNRQGVTMGSVTDRNGLLLAATDEEGDRYYNEDDGIRLAVSQTVGDTLSIAGAGVQTRHADLLTGVSGTGLGHTWQLIKQDRIVGNSLQLTVDAELCKYIASVFPEGMEGAVAVMNWRTGEILAMVSMPEYDPENLTRSNIDTEGTAYLNRCLQGRYTPGSVMKIVTLATVLEYFPEKTQEMYDCKGTSVIEGYPIHCTRGEAHGRMTLEAAFAKSCNNVFAHLAAELGFDRMINNCETMGFNDNFHLDDIMLYESVYPSEVAGAGDLGWSGVGQSSVLVTPMHVCMIAASVANGGTIPEPKLILNVTGSTGTREYSLQSESYGTGMSPQVAATVKEYMRSCVAWGTGTNAAIQGYSVCGKTGSAEVSDNKNVPTDAWFAGFIDSDEAPYAIAVVVEGGGSGGNLAAGIARKTFAFMTK